VANCSMRRAAQAGSRDGCAPGVRELQYPTTKKMDNPLREIEGVVKGLVRANDASQQRECLQKYYTKDASFDHPMCAVASTKNVRKWSLMPSLAIQVFFRFTSGFASCLWILLLRSIPLVRTRIFSNIQPMMRRTSASTSMQLKRFGAISRLSVLCWCPGVDWW